jgi:formate-dependent nitrite reductase membrane component NrfD|tara:strand:+ start:321 stop:584 length:264 start_codon:yes stop_codon:yes gene_type:complete
MGLLITWLIAGLSAGVIFIYNYVKDINNRNLTRENAFKVIVLATLLGFFSVIIGLIFIVVLLTDSDKWKDFWNTPLINDKYYKSKKK